MFVVVVGAGAMGGLIGARLSSAGSDLLLYDIWQEHVEAIQRHGLLIETLDGTQIRYRLRATERVPEELAEADLVVVMTKSYDTFTALQPLAGLIRSDAVVLSLQNGLGNEEQIRAALPEHRRLVIGTTAHAAQVRAPGRIWHAGKGPTAIGDPAARGATPTFPLTGLRNLLQKAGFETTIARNVHAAVWTKLIANAAINPTTALTGLRNGQLLDDPDVATIVEQVVNEVLAVMRAAGIAPLVDDPLAHARAVMQATRDNDSSMLQDIRRGRRTEIDAISGAIVRMGDELGVPVPTNRWLAAFVRHREDDARRTIHATR